ncbi:MAG: LacI family transcriptional regulator [Treponema sp.]|jgi:LacI family transcriptional regulator|nr:LacI family transcriptional regulator [Treponema sp.]
MTGKRLTIRDIAKVTGVSYATVSRALSGSADISDKTRKRILAACDKLGYTANYMARSLVARKSKLIGFILGRIDNPYMGQLACQAEIYARQKGYSLILCNSMNREQHEAELFSLLLGRQVDGIIIIPANSGSHEALGKYFEQIPTVFIGENLKDARKNYVTVDNYQGTRIGTEYLISLGHRAIVYIGHRPGSATHQLRTAGYIDACKGCGLAPVIIDNHEPASSLEQGYRLAKILFSRPRPCTAVFAATDTTALGVMKAADEAGIGIPEQVSLIGFDNISYSMLPRINLTTLEQPFYTMAAAAVDMLIKQIEEPAPGYSHTVLAPTLVKRGTCKAVT